MSFWEVCACFVHYDDSSAQEITGKWKGGRMQHLTFLYNPTVHCREKKPSLHFAKAIEKPIAISSSQPHCGSGEPHSESANQISLDKR